MATNRRIVSKDDSGKLYPTPVWATKALLEFERFAGSVLEPCCGDGSMSEVLKASGLVVSSSDVVDHGYGEVKDFFDVKDRVDNIITNPPYSIAGEIWDHAYQLAIHKVALLLRLAFLEGIERYDRIFEHNAPARIYVFSERLSMFPKGDDRTKGGTTAYAWFVWDRYEPLPTTVYWIPPGTKDRLNG